jgi:hypothetical protein
MSLPGAPAGTVYLRVSDTDHTPGNKTLDTVHFDQLYIRTESAAGDPPVAPTSLVAVPVGHDQVNLTWDDNSADESGFGIERRNGGGAFAPVNSVGPGQQSYNDTGLAGATTYEYRVRSFNAAGNSAWTQTASATTGAPPPPPDIALNLSGYKDKGKHVVNLTWSGAMGSSVDIYRDGGLLLSTANDNSHTDQTGNKGARTYAYEVCEAGTANCSGPQLITF